MSAPAMGARRTIRSGRTAKTRMSGIPVDRYAVLTSPQGIAVPRRSRSEKGMARRIEPSGTGTMRPPRRTALADPARSRAVRVVPLLGPPLI